MRVGAHGAGAGRDAWRCARWRAARHRCPRRSAPAGPGSSSAATSSRGRRGGKEAAHELDDVAQADAIRLGLQQVELDLRLVARIGRAQRHLAAALRMQQHAGIRERGARRPCASRGNHGRANIDTGRHQHLQVRPVEMRRGAHQALRGQRRARQDAVAEHLPLQHRQRQPIERAAGCRSRTRRWRRSPRSATGDPAGSRRRPAARAARGCHAARDPPARRCPRAAAAAAN